MNVSIENNVKLNFFSFEHVLKNVSLVIVSLYLSQILYKTSQRATTDFMFAFHGR